MDDETSWQKQLLIGVVLLLVVGALIGGVVAVASIKAADLAGINGTTGTGTGRSNEHLHVPRNAGTPTTAPLTTAPPASSAAPTSAHTSAPTSKPPRPAFRLTISPRTASTYERINLTGTCQAPDGTSLQVQRMEAGTWLDFPTTASVSAGTFTTYVETGHTGVNRFRMTDTASGRSSNVATVTVH